MSAPVQRLLVVGRDADVWLAALALQRAFGRQGLSVTVLELPGLLTPADAYVGLPSLSGLHALLGLDEAAVMAATSGAPVLGQRYANWGRTRPAFVHGYDAQRVGIEDIDLHQFWVRARADGLTVAYEDFQLASVAARQGRSVLGADGHAVEAPVGWGRHMDARRYAALLRQVAVGAGVTVRSGRVDAVERDGDRIRAVTEGGERLDADLFIDASGAEAVLASEQPGAEFESWRDLFGADRVMVASAPPLSPAPGFSQIAAFRAGWVGQYPLADRTAVVACYDSRAMDDQAVLDALPALTGRALDADASVETFEAGIRPAWTGNCVAIGAAAARLEPLDGAPLHLVHIGLSQLIAYFPVDAKTMPEARSHNAAMRRHIEGVRDFQLAHYRLNQRFDEYYWDRARAAPTPERLAWKLEAFAARGLLPTYDDETFQEQNWTQVLIGHGLIPRAHDPLVNRLTSEDQMGRFKTLLSRIADQVRGLPTADEAVRR